MKMENRCHVTVSYGIADINVKTLIKSIGPNEFGFEKAAYLLLFGDFRIRRSWMNSVSARQQPDTSDQFYQRRYYEGAF